MQPNELCFLSATELARRVRSKELSAREVTQAHVNQIERVNHKVNAIVTYAPEQALAAALAADERQANGAELGVLHGLPVAHKDLVETKGMRTTLGSPLFADWRPDFDALIVERLRQAGAITLGKTNTPEFGAGSHTFNTVFGATLNPWDVTKTCGGSSGGAAVTLACGMAPIADGSDLGGSLRNPGNFNNIVGFRPSLGRVPAWPNARAWSGMSTLGPMARSVADVALMLSVIARPDARAPAAMYEGRHDAERDSGALFRAPLERDFTGARVAWSADLGCLPIDPRVARVLESALPAFAAIGCSMDAATPDFAGADATFKTLRAFAMTGRAALLATHREQIKATVIWNIEAGLKLSALDVGNAEAMRTQLYDRMRAFLDRYEFLICPVNQVPPFDVTTEYPVQIAGEAMHTYIDWMKSCYFITVTGHPAISVPAGFTTDGLPVGVQIVGRFGDDLGVLQLAHAFEQATRFGARRPPVVA